MANKLQVIAQLSGSFAVGALLANQLPSLSDQEDGISVITSIFLPRTAHAFTVFRKSTTLAQSPERVRAFHALDAEGRVTKVYPVELRIKSLASQFEFSTLRLAFVRAVIFTYVPMVDAYFKELNKAEKEAEERGDEADWSDLPKFDWDAAKNRIPWVTFAMARDLLVGVVRILLTWGAAEYLDSQLVWKLVKDQTSSLRAKRRFPFYERPIAVTKTCLRGLVIATLAEFIVGSALESFRILHNSRVPRQAKGMLVRRRLTGKAFSLTVNLVASSTAAGLVAVVIPPGIASIGTSLLAGFGSDMLISLPAVQEYESKGRISRRTAIIGSACVAVVLWSFSPWILPSFSGSHRGLQPAVTQPM